MDGVCEVPFYEGVAGDEGDIVEVKDLGDVRAGHCMGDAVWAGTYPEVELELGLVHEAG